MTEVKIFKKSNIPSSVKYPPAKIMQPRYFFAAFFIILEVALLLAVFILLNRFSIIMSVLSIIFAASVILYVINKDELHEFKIPWLIMFIVLPIVGAFIYILINNTRQIKNVKNAFDKSNEMLAPYIITSNLSTLQEQNSEYSAEAYLQANYLYSAAGMPCHNHSKVTYYRIGEDFHKALLEELEKAEHFIFMEYFLIEKGKMWNSIHDILVKKSKAGIKVYVMYDDFGCMNILPQHYYEELQKEGIECISFNRFRPVLSQIHNNRDHRKITVIDGITGFIGGCNLMDEYINAKVRFGHWKDNAVKIEGEAVKNLTILFLSAWNFQQNIQRKKKNKTLLECSQYLDVNYHVFETDKAGTANAGTAKAGTAKAGTAKAVIPFGSGPTALYKSAIGRDVYLNIINSAKKYLYITTPYLICDFAFFNAIGMAAKKGIDVRIIMPGIPDKKLVFLMSRSNYELLIRDGVKIYEYSPGFIHAKTLISDDEFAVCGTINLDYRSLIHHFECGVWMYNIDAIQEMKTDFLETMALSEHITAEKAKLTRMQKLIRNVMKIFFPLL